MNKNKIYVAGGIVLAVAVVVGVVVVGGRKRDVAKRVSEERLALHESARPVTLERVRSVDSRRERSFPGVVKASEESALSFRVGGPLTEVNVKLGEPVKKGDLLMQIDPRDFEDRIESLEARLAGAEAVFQNARQDYGRISKLFEEKVVPQSNYDLAKSALDSAEASVKGLNVQLQIARHSLEDTSLLAPYGGTVTEQLVENHEMVDSGTVVLRFHNIQWLEVVVNVPENEIAHRGMDREALVRVRFPAIPGKAFDAHLTEWSSVADPMTRTYAVTFRFEAPTEFKVLPGMSAKVSWQDGSESEPRLVVPMASLSSGAEGSTVLWVYNEEGGNAERRAVSTGRLEGSSHIVVLSGVTEGEQVVLSGSRFIHEGMTLESIGTE